MGANAQIVGMSNGIFDIGPPRRTELTMTGRRLPYYGNVPMVSDPHAA
jgi:hypothetical protein